MDFSPNRRRSPLILELTPLIDVVFLLLIFFMVSTTFVQEPAALEVDLPQSSASALVPEGSDTEILLGPEGEVLFRGESMSLEENQVLNPEDVVLLPMTRVPRLFFEVTKRLPTSSSSTS